MVLNSGPTFSHSMRYLFWPTTFSSNSGFQASWTDNGRPALVRDEDGTWKYLIVFRRSTGSTAWYPQTDGQSELTNQTVEIALRFFLSTGEQDWLSVLPYLRGSLNNAVRATGFALDDLTYGFRVREGLDILGKAGPDVQDLERLRSVKREDAQGAMAFANVAVKSRNPGLAATAF